MPRRANPLPSHSFLLINRATNWLAGIFLFVLLVVFIAVWTVTYTIRRDCQHPYNRNIKVFGYWLQVDAGSTKKECPSEP